MLELREGIKVRRLKKLTERPPNEADGLTDSVCLS